MGRRRGKNGRRGDGGSGFWAAGYSGGRGLLFQDTIIVQNSTADPSADMQLSVVQLVPSIGNGRRVLPHRIHVEICPTLWNGGVSANSDMLQFQLGAIDTTATTNGVTYPVMPFKMCSNINPTSATVNFETLKKICPTLVRVMGSDGSNPLLNIEFKPFDLLEPRLFQMRITTEVWVLPQISPNVLVNPT